MFSDFSRSGWNGEQTTVTTNSIGTEVCPLEMGLSELEVGISMVTKWLQLPARKGSGPEILQG